MEEVSSGFDEGMEGIANLDVLSDISLETVDSVSSHDEPYLQRSETMGEWDLQVAKIDGVLRARNGVAEIRSVH